MQKIFLSFLTVSLFFSFHCLGQTEDLEPEIAPQTFSPRFNIGINGGATFPFTDVSAEHGGKGAIIKPAFEVSGHYAPLPFLSILASVQKGALSAGVDNSQYRYFQNSYWSELVMARFSPFGLMRNATYPNSLIYLGVGAAFIHSNTDATLQNGINNGALGHYKGTDFSLPVEIGFTMPFLTTNTGAKLAANINYRHYMIFSDEIDGYNPPKEVNKHKDAYGFLSLGLSYQFKHRP